MCHILVVGGDMRNLFLARELKSKGASVSICGIDSSLPDTHFTCSSDSFKNELLRADVIVLPLPCTKDGVTIHTPLSEHKLLLNDVFIYSRKNAIICGGKMDCGLFEKHGLKAVDYAGRDDFSSLNAVPTCEGAIEAAMKLMPITIFSSNAFVTGFGKCAKVLALTLKAMGANVTVCARSVRDLSLAEALGMTAVKIENMRSALNSADVVFNTVPCKIFKSEELAAIKNDVALIDLASSPGGADADEAEKNGVNYIFLPAIPGKYSPVTAARIILKTITNIIGESGKDANSWIFGEKE